MRTVELDAAWKKEGSVVPPSAPFPLTKRVFDRSRPGSLSINRFTGNAIADATSLIGAIRSGRVFTCDRRDCRGPAYIEIESDPSGRPLVNYAVPDGGELIMVRGGHDSLPLQDGAVGRYRFKDER